MNRLKSFHLMSIKNNSYIEYLLPTCYQLVTNRGTVCSSEQYANISKTPHSQVLCRVLIFGGDGGNRSARFCARRHAAPKNSPPDCFLNGCFDYIPQQKYKSTTRVLLIFGGDGGNRNRVQNRLTKGSTSVFYLLGLSPHISAVNGLYATVSSNT